MIVAERKPIAEIAEMVKDYNKIMIVGCGTCVSICFAGGEKEVGILSSALKMFIEKSDNKIEIIEDTITRQCEKEMVDEIREKVDKVDAVLSLACGAGVQTFAEVFPDKIILPGLNTTFMGSVEEHGVWVENCAGCGNCLLDVTMAICPIARCSKNLLNGPCGGTTEDGKCEVNKEIDCAWYLIYKKLDRLGKLDVMEKIQPPKDWTTSAHGGPRKIVREDVKLSKEEE